MYPFPIKYLVFFCVACSSVLMLFSASYGTICRLVRRREDTVANRRVNSERCINPSFINASRSAHCPRL